jgi:peptidoglycan/xylan/chitin deacetylase (PgdA/CDA1 family)
MVLVGLVAIGLLVIGCDPAGEPDPFLTVTLSIISPAHSTPTSRPVHPTSTVTPTVTATASPTQPLPTLTLTVEPTPTWVWHAPGEVLVPILLYHHITETGGTSRYAVSAEDFRQQMHQLRDWGVTTVTISQLVEVLISGGELPPRPVVITFDDGNLDVYTSAFPILQSFGFQAVVYLVANRLEDEAYLSVKQVKELIAAGWEVGSHSLSHLDLTANHALARREILTSRLILEEALGVPVKTFAYPFGLVDEYVAQKVQDYGYRAGVGLGIRNIHGLGDLYYLQRREVRNDMNLAAFNALFPWREGLADPWSTPMTPSH